MYILIHTARHTWIAEKIDNPLFIPKVTDGSDNPTVESSTTVFVSAANEVSASMSEHTPLNSVLLTNAEISVQQDIIAFLKKPVLLSSGSFAVTDTVQGFSPINLPTAMVSLEPFASKLKGFLGMRADITVRLIINANRFQAGRYILAFCPTVGAGTNAASRAATTKFACLTTITQLPHVEIDLSTETSAVLNIPYVSFLSHLPINPSGSTEVGLLGVLRLFTYSALRAVAGSTTVPFEIYANFENISLAAPCVPQSNKFKPKNNTAQEQVSQGVGPLSGSLRKVSKATNLIGMGVPSLTALAAPVSWALDLAADVASVFGWSKPTNLDAPTRVTQSIMPYLGSCDTVDNSIPISLFSRNQIEIMPGFAGNDMDEMSLDHIKAIPAYHLTYPWTTSDTVGTTIAAIIMSPASFGMAFTSGSVIAKAYCPVSFLQKFFRAYRGGLRLTFKIVKTEFHSGRLSIAYNPTVPYQSPTVTSPADAPYVHREIVDIRDGTSFDFIVPYTSLTPYKNYNENFGTVTVSVINPLIAPATVSSTIDLILEVSAAPDFEYAIPFQSALYIPTGVYNPQSSKFVPTTDVNSIRTAVIGGSEIKVDNDISSRACVGEKVKSLLSIMKKHSIYASSTNEFFVVPPFYCKLGQTTATVPQTTGQSDYIDIFSHMFALSRGGVRFKAIPNTPLSKTYKVTTLMDCPVTTSIAPYVLAATPTVTYRNSNIVVNTTAFGGGTDLSVPNYDNVYARSVLECSGNFTDTGYNFGSVGAAQLLLQIETPEGATNSWSIFRAAADDFQLGYFVGVPIITET